MLRLLALVLPAWLLLAGCAHRPPGAGVRLRSFSEHTETQVEGTLLKDHLRMRSALLIAGTEVEVVRPGVFSGKLNLRFEEGRPYLSAMATAIDPRGYFLTSGRNASRSPVYLILHDGIGFQVFRARVVWQGDFNQRQPDLALLHVARPLLQVFEWGEAPRPGAPIVGAGPDRSADDQLLTTFAGTLESVSPRTNHTPPSTTYFHASPVISGDYGGPLTTADGRLLAINVGIFRVFQWHRLSYSVSARAHRPDLPWLQELIEQDFAQHHDQAGANRP